jgi:hemerythrin-like domain-containing protein
MRSIMDEKVSRLPIILFVAAGATGLLVFSALQYQGKREVQQQTFDALEREHQETARVMRKAGEQGVEAQAKEDEEAEARRRASKSYIELKRLEDEDRAALRRP